MDLAECDRAVKVTLIGSTPYVVTDNSDHGRGER
jgi:hypothetical protein